MLENLSNIKNIIDTYQRNNLTQNFNNKTDEEINEYIHQLENDIKLLEKIKFAISGINNYLSNIEKMDICKMRYQKDCMYLAELNIDEFKIYDTLALALKQNEILMPNKKITLKKLKLGKKKMIIITYENNKLILDEEFIQKACTDKKIPLTWYQNNDNFFQKICQILY